MSPAQMPGPAYWASGGELRGRCGPLTRDRAAEVLQCLQRQIEASRKTGDLAAAGALGGMARNLRFAIAAAEDWHRAAEPLSPLHFVRDANSLEHG
jgi:hypothetical protein